MKGEKPTKTQINKRKTQLKNGYTLNFPFKALLRDDLQHSIEYRRRILIVERKFNEF